MHSIIAPELGVQFRYHRSIFVAKGWWKPAPPKQIPAGADEILRELWEEDIAEEAEDGITRMMRCRREEATHVSGSGVCGCIAPIDEIEVLDDAPAVPADRAIEINEAHARRLGQILSY